MLGIQKVYFNQQTQIRSNYYASKRAFGSKNEDSSVGTVNLQYVLRRCSPETQQLLNLPQDQRLTAILSLPQEEQLGIIQKFTEVPTRSFVDIKVDPAIFDLPEEICKEIIKKPDSDEILLRAYETMNSLNVAKDGRTYGWIKSIVFYLDAMEEPAVKQKPDILIKIEQRVETLYNYLFKTFESDKLSYYIKDNAPNSEAKLDRFLEKINHPHKRSNYLSNNWLEEVEKNTSEAAIRFSNIMKR